MDLNQIARRVFFETLGAIEPGLAIRQNLQLDGGVLSVAGRQVSLDKFSEVVLVGMGKASLKMGAAVESLLGDRVRRGILVTDRGSAARLRSDVVIGGHPLPDLNSLIAGKKIIELVRSCGDQSLIVFLISGGGSSLVEVPLSPSISLEDLRRTNQVLVGCGATIREINTVRKSLSAIKGGRLGGLANRSKWIGLYISDVNPGDLRSIASNPLLPEDLDVGFLLDIASRFDLMARFPGSVATLLQQGVACDPDGRSQSGDSQPLTSLVLDNSSAIRPAAELAERLGLKVEVAADVIEGEYRTVSETLVDRLRSLRSRFPSEPVCVISGGEVSCAVSGQGVGGRNQEFVLYSAARLAGTESSKGATVLSCGTDGIDGNSKAAGAIADPALIIEAARHGSDAWDFISRNDSHSFFKRAGGLVVTGPTGNNVRDLRILMAQ